MPDFVLNQPQETDQPTISVESKLQPGTYRFQLEVIDTDGLTSAPAFTTVTIRDLPIAKLTAPSVVQTGQTFTLSGDGSTDPGGQIKTYRFTLVPDITVPIGTTPISTTPVETLPVTTTAGSTPTGSTTPSGTG